MGITEEEPSADLRVVELAAELLDRVFRGRRGWPTAAIAHGTSMSKNDRRRIRAVTDELMDPSHVSWVGLEGVDRDRGMFALRLIRQVLGLPG